MIISLKKKTLKTKTIESVVQNRYLNKTKLRKKNYAPLPNIFATRSTGIKRNVVNTEILPYVTCMI